MEKIKLITILSYISMYVMLSASSSIAAASASNIPADTNDLLFFDDYEYDDCGTTASEVVPLAITGPSKNRIDLVVAPYRYHEVDAHWFQAAAEEYHRIHFEIPMYRRYEKFFNVYRYDRFVPDGEPIDTNTMIRTMRHIEPRRYLDQAAPLDWGELLVDRGNAADGDQMDPPGGEFTVTVQYENNAYYVNNLFIKGNALHTALIKFSALHESAHIRFGFGDGGHCGTPNVNCPDEQSIKWAHWMGFDQKVPNGGDYIEDDYVDVHDPADGLIEGCGQLWGPLYLASPWSLMTSGGKRGCGWNMALNAVEREHALLTLYERYLDPLDGWADNESVRIDPNLLWVDPVDKDVIDVVWQVNGTIVPTGTHLHVGALNLPPGRHTITARAYDNVLNHRFSDRSSRSADGPIDQPELTHPLDWVRKDFDKLEQTISWDVQITHDGPASSSSLIEHSGARFTLDKRSAIGRGLGFAYASPSPRGPIQYRLVHNGGTKAFAVDAESGRISTACDVSSLRNDQYQIGIEASDGVDQAVAFYEIDLYGESSVIIDDRFDDGSLFENQQGVGLGFWVIGDKKRIDFPMLEQDSKLVFQPEHHWPGMFIAARDDIPIRDGVRITWTIDRFEGSESFPDSLGLYLASDGDNVQAEGLAPAIILDLTSWGSWDARLHYKLEFAGSREPLKLMSEWAWDDVWDHSGPLELVLEVSLNNFVVRANGQLMAQGLMPAEVSELWDSDTAELMLKHVHNGTTPETQGLHRFETDRLLVERL